MGVNTLQITTGEKHIPVSVDGINGRELVFNPNDARFTERFYQFYQAVWAKIKEWESNAETIAKAIDSIPTDENGLPETIAPAMQPLREVNQFMRDQIDSLFGAGTSQAIFGDAIYRNPEIYIQLVEGIKPYITPVREEKIAKYLPSKKRVRK